MSSKKTLLTTTAITLTALLSASCIVSPLDRTITSEISDHIRSTNHKYESQRNDSKTFLTQSPKLDVTASLKPKIRKQLETQYGPNSYQAQELDLGNNLLNSKKVPTKVITLDQAVKLATTNNFALMIASIQTQITAEQTTQAEATFDHIFFTNFNYSKLDTPPPSSNLAFSTSKSETRTLETGIRKLVNTGGTVTLQTQYTRRDTTSQTATTNPYHSPNISLTLNQPLLRGFGKTTARAQINLQVNANENSKLEQKSTFIQTTLNTISTYRQLYQAQQNLLIQLQLKDRIVALRDKMRQRTTLDATDQDITQAESFVASTQKDVSRARLNLRIASDNLKRLINDKAYPLTSELVLLTSSLPEISPLSINRIDSIIIAMKNRPDIKQAILQISDSHIRQRVADNARLPQLNLNTTIRANGVDKNGDAAFSKAADGSYVDYIIGLEYEMPIGNRAAKALALQRRLERNAAILNYYNVVQQAELEVIQALRSIINNFELVTTSHEHQLAAANNLRTFEVKELTTAELNPSFLDQKMQSQQRLAESEIDEVRVQTEYLISIDRLHAATGTLLEQHGIPLNTDE